MGNRWSRSKVSQIAPIKQQTLSTIYYLLPTICYLLSTICCRAEHVLRMRVVTANGTIADLSPGRVTLHPKWVILIHSISITSVQELYAMPNIVITADTSTSPSPC